MGIEYREELVGKRFLCVVGNLKPKTPISEWPWRAGIIRAVDKTTPAVHGKDAIVYVEFDGQDWDKREWFKISNKSHQVFLVEKTVIWAERVDPYAQVPSNIVWPALVYKSLVDRCGFKDSTLKPVEFFLDNLLDFYKKGDTQPYKEDSRKTLNKPIFKRYPDVKLELDRWLHEQSEQHILMKAPYGLSGYRVKVYRIGSTTQWFTAVITGHDLMTRDLVVMDDTVLESHTENPAHVHMMFLDDVVNSLLKGENVGITSRRRAAAAAAAAVTGNNNSQASSVTNFSRSINSSHSPASSSLNYQSPQAPKKKRTKGMNDSAAQEPEKETKEKAIRQEKSLKEKEKTISNKTKKERKRKPEEIINEELKTLSETVKKTKSSSGGDKDPLRQDTSEPAASGGSRSPAEERLQSLSSEETGTSTHQEGTEAPRDLPPGHKHESVITHKPSVSPAALPPGGGGGIDPSSGSESLKQSMSNYRTDSEAKEERESVDIAAAVKNGPNAASSTKESNVRKSPTPPITAPSSLGKVSGTSDDKSQPLSSSSSSSNKDTSFLFKLSQAISASPGKRAVKSERDTPFTHAIAGIIARELSKDYENLEKDQAKQEGATEQPVGKEQPITGSTTSVPTTSASVSSSPNLFSSMQTMISAQVSAQEAVIPAVPSEAMVKNCLMQTMNAGLKQPPVSSPKEVRPSSATPPSQRVHSSAARSDPEKAAASPRRKVEKGPSVSSAPHVAPKMSEKPRSVDIERKDREAAVNHERKEKIKKEMHEFREGREGSRQEAIHRSKEMAGGFGGGQKEPVRVFRDPNLRDNNVTHVHSIQHHLYHQMGKQDHHKATPVPSSHTPLSTLRTAATPGGPISGSPSAFAPSNLHSNALQPSHAILPPHIQLYPHHLQGFSYSPLHAVDQHGYHQQQQHLAELMALRHQLGLSGLVPGQPAALMQAGAAHGLTPAQLQALLQSQHAAAIAMPPGILIPHTQEDLEIAHLQAQREQQKLHAEKVAQMETKAILHADKHLFSSSPHPPQHARLTPQTTSSAGSTHHPLGHDGISYRGGGDIRNHHQDVPMVDVHAAIERHFQESLGKPHVAFSISPYSSASGSITMGTPLAKTDHRSVSSEKELQKEQLEQDRLRREREEKELEWQRLQREKEYKQNQIQKEMERKIMYPSSGIVSERERLQKLASSIDVKNDDHLYKHVMSQLKPKYIGLSSAEKKSEKILMGDSIGSALKSHSSQGFQVFQPYKSGSGSNKPSSGLKYEEARPGVPVRTEHNRLKSAPAYMLPFQPKTHLEGYVPFGHTVSSSKKHEDKGDNGLLGHRGSSHSPHGISHEDKKGIPNPPPLIKNEPGLGSHDYRDGHTIHEMGAKSLWEKQIVESLKAQQGLLPVKSEGPYSVPVIVRRSESGHHPHMQHMDSSPLKVASPQQLSRAALQTMEVKSMSTASSSRATLSQSSPGVNISTSVVSQSSILMNALRPSEHHHHHHHHHHRKVDKQSYEPKDLSLGTKRKSPNQPMAVKKRVKEAAVMGVATSDKDFRKAGAVTSFSEHCQSYQPKEQSPLISGGGVTHAKVSENVELKIEKVDQLKRVPPDPSSVQRLTGLPNLFAKNGSLSDSERSRSVSPRSMSDSSDSRKTSSPNRTATGHVKCKKAWLQRLSESTDSPPPPEEKKDFKSGTAAKSLPNGHIHSPNATSTTVTEKSTVTLSDIQKSIPERVYDFDSMSTCSDSSSASGGSKPRQRRSRENKKSRKRTASPLVVNPSCIIDTSHHPPVNGLNLGLETKVKLDGMGDHKQVTASLIDLMTEAPKKRIVTRAHKEKDREAFNLERSLSKPAISKLKKTGEAFLQDGPCTNITPNLMKCRECRMKGNKQSKLNIFCRFYAFRRLRYSQKGNLTIAGFSELDQYEKEDLGPWLPTRIEEDDPNTDLEVSKYIMLMTADKFCELVLQEKDAKGALTCSDGKMAWKRPVSGVREMCDTCDTTLFNIHWTCPKCGFVVCPDCFKAKTGNSTRSMKAKSPEVWLKCIKDQQHLPENLMLTQIIPGSALWDICTLVHEIRRRWNLPSTCPCSRLKSSPPGDAESTKENDVKTEVQPEQNAVSSTMVSTTGNTITATSSSTSALDFLADVATSRSNDAKCDFEAPPPPSSQNGETQVDSSSNVKTAADTTTEVTCDPTTNSNSSMGQTCSTLRELLTKTASKMGTPGGPVDGSSFLSALLPKKENSVKSKHRTMTSTFEDIIATVVEQHIAEPRIKPDRSLQKPSRGPFNMFKSPPAIQTGSKNTLTESSFLYPDVPHSWLCDGKLLRLHEPSNKGNFKIFQEQWGKGVPVLVSNIQKQLKSSLWNPRYFSKQFGNIENDLVDCRKGTVIQGAPMKDFWDGFEDLTNRLETKQGQSMILKLKDWPPAEDFSEILPEHFEDLMGNLPLPEYTRRDGVLNLSSRLPDFFVKPDLGPKMYNAYGLARYPCAGTTNLHLDISDAVNVMVHVGIPHGGQKDDDKAEALISEAVEAVQEHCKDEQTRQRLIEDKETPGALWHIFRARDAPRIRSFLNKLSEEQGEQILLDHDPIHDQSWYLDEEKLARLKEEYKVEGWAIAQCLGDAVFIPAGAPHQVRNLHSCIKVAEDFVSPEHIKECVYLTDEFRHLSNTHSNHEDKLQIKNILYHAIKDAIGVLMSHDPLVQGTGETT